MCLADARPQAKLLICTSKLEAEDTYVRHVATRLEIDSMTYRGMVYLCWTRVVHG